MANSLKNTYAGNKSPWRRRIIRKRWRLIADVASPTFLLDYRIGAVMRAMITLSVAVMTVGMLWGQAMASKNPIFPGPRAPLPSEAQDDLTPRGLYISKSADAMRVRILDARTGAVVSPTQHVTT